MLMLSKAENTLEKYIHVQEGCRDDMTRRCVHKSLTSCYYTYRSGHRMTGILYLKHWQSTLLIQRARMMSQELSDLYSWKYGKEGRNLLAVVG